MKALFIFCAFVLTGCLSTQNLSKSVTPDDLVTQHDVKVKKDRIFSAAYTNNVRAAVIADFLERFGEVPNVTWYVDNAEVKAFFNREGVQVNVLYRPDGLHLQTRKNYDGTKLDQRVSRLLQRELGKKFSVNLVTEVIKDNHVCYEVSLLSETQLYFVRVYKDSADETLAVVGKTLFKRGD